MDRGLYSANRRLGSPNALPTHPSVCSEVAVYIALLYVLCCVGMLHQYFISPCSSLAPLQSCFARATCRLRPPPCLQLLLDISLFLCVTSQTSYWWPRGNHFQWTHRKRTNEIWKKPTWAHASQRFDLSYNAAVATCFILTESELIWSYFKKCWQLSSVWSTLVPSWQLQYKLIFHLVVSNAIFCFLRDKKSNTPRRFVHSGLLTGSWFLQLHTIEKTKLLHANNLRICEIEHVWDRTFSISVIHATA